MVGTKTRRPLAIAAVVVGAFSALLVIQTNEPFVAFAAFALIALAGLVADSVRETVASCSAAEARRAPRYARPRGRGGTGRRAGFRSRWAQALGGSTPLARTSRVAGRFDLLAPLVSCRPMATETLICSACGRESPADAAFCARCGASLEAPGAYELEERKVVTVLFADLVGSTARAESHDPEEVRGDPVRLLRAPACGARALRRHGREVHRRRRDGGVRRAGGARGRSERAVRAALAIRDALAEGRRRRSGRGPHRRGTRCARSAARGGRGDGRRRCGQHGGSTADRRARQRRPRRRGDLSGNRAAIDYGSAIEVHAKGKVRAGACVGGARARSALSAWTSARRPRQLVGRDEEVGCSRARSSAPTGARAAARHARRRSRDRQEPARLRAVQVVRGADRAHLRRQGRCLPYGEGSLLGARRWRRHRW